MFKVTSSNPITTGIKEQVQEDGMASPSLGAKVKLEPWSPTLVQDTHRTTCFFMDPLLSFITSFSICFCLLLPNLFP